MRPWRREAQRTVGLGSVVSGERFFLHPAFEMRALVNEIAPKGPMYRVLSPRTREFGIRTALGAAHAGVRRMVVVQGLRVVRRGVLVRLVGRCSARAL